MTHIVDGNPIEESSDTFSHAYEIFDQVAEWLGLGDQEFAIKVGLHSSYTSEGFVNVLLNDVTLPKCRPPGNSSSVYLRVEIEGDLEPRFQNCSFKLMLSRYR
ncbi:hypothetical protein IWW57_002607 [Coemansia sp. S610]|nr:hypothetical protein IWW57_002607 [Coemansia sp. S610]